MEDSDLSFRRARHDDYDAVVELDPDLYDGYDYMPYWYHTYLQHPYRYLYVALKGQKVVSFTLKIYLVIAL